jgi:hypothetical protein
MAAAAINVNLFISGTPQVDGTGNRAMGVPGVIQKNMAGLRSFGW